jgi:uncharacterized damage-inducible protein DinB
MHDDRRITAAADQLDTATARLRESLERLSDEAATKSSPDGGWSPAQIVYHVAITNEGFFHPAFDGSAPFLAKAPDGFSETFSFDTIPGKLKTFPQLEPPAVAKAEAIEKLNRTATALAAAMRALPAERVGHCATLPFGTLSMQQMAEFAAGHVLRHQAQLERAISTSA